MTPPDMFQVHLLFVQAAIAFFILGYCWKRGAPRYLSPYGLLFRSSKASPENWRWLHERSGKLLMVLSLILLIPIDDVKVIYKIQVPLFGASLVLGVLILKWRLDYRMKGKK